jgi:isoleucyl-tRNA synthetase
VCIVSDVKIERKADSAFVGGALPMTPGDSRSAKFAPAEGRKCDRCWRVLPEVGQSRAHPTLCRRCEAVVEAQPSPRAAA